MAAYNLTEVDSVEVTIIVNDEIDLISHSPHPVVKHAGSFMGVTLTPLSEDTNLGGARSQMRMDNICCGAHGFSTLITATKGPKKHTLLFDAGPEDDVWERNATRLGLDLASVEYIQLSHWHRDHTGGLLRAIQMINAAKNQAEVVVDVHPDRPDYRGIMTPTQVPIALEADPTFKDIEAVGGLLLKSDQVHTILEDTFLVSGAIPRTSDYELGIPGGIRLNTSSGKWEADEMIFDERLLMCNIKGKGLVVFTGCSHPGVVNTARHAQELGGHAPLYAIVGGYHLADADPEKLRKSMDDLKALNPQVLMPGHCTGWRFKYMIHDEMPNQMVPIFGGTKYTL